MIVSSNNNTNGSKTDPSMIVVTSNNHATGSYKSEHNEMIVISNNKANGSQNYTGSQNSDSKEII